MLANALALPHFDYCSPVWSNCSGELANSLQILQNRLARIILSADIRTPTDEMMDKLNWIKLDKRWYNQLLVIVLKCIKDQAPSYLSSNLTFTHSVHNIETRGQISNMLYLPKWNSNSGKRTFNVRAVKIWNDLPSNIRSNFNTMSLSMLKNATLCTSTKTM